MLKMIKGSVINDADKLNEEYVMKETYLKANINADKILKIMNEFVDLQDDPLFLILEVPTNKNDEEIKDGVIEAFHKDVYFLDGISKDYVKEILRIFGNLFINDGLANIGVANHITKAEIMTGKYNVVTIFNGDDEKAKYEKLLMGNSIKKVEKLVTAWDFFSENNPGNCYSIEENGKTVYDAVEVLKEAGLYFYERRED